jgi:ABC-type multidrug transport system ATPase subunit
MSSSLLEINNIKKRFGDFEALKGVSLSLFRGEILSLLGVNGAGKTTLSSIVATLHPPTEGTITMNGISVYDDIVAYRHLIGYCPQKPNLHNQLTLYDNLLFAGRFFGMPDIAIKARIITLSEQLGLGNFLQSKPDTLSGGYKQRFSIARSLIHNPQLIILDEPTVALDPHIRHQLWQLIRELKELRITVLLTTHYLDEAEVLSDRVCVLDQGTIRLIDTPQNLMSSYKHNNLEDVFLHLINEREQERKQS